MPDSRRKNVVRGFLIAVVIAVPIVAVLAASAFWFVLDRPFGDPDAGPVEILIPRGTSFDQLSMELENTGLIANAEYLQWRYRIASRLGIANPHQAGRYALYQGSKPSDILKSITSPGDTQRVYTELTIPPGSTSSRIGEIVEDAGLARANDVVFAVKSLAAEYPIVGTDEGLQGYLFPDTYKIETPIDESMETSKTTAESIIRIMADNFFEVLDEIDPNWTKLTPLQLHEKITLASIVEREYRVEDEAPMIAAVFNNRIIEGMPLQSCATVVYTIEETEIGMPFQEDYLRFNRRIFERYLEIESPYNTYQNLDLPPGPISNPGSVSLDAAFYPAQIDALFFVVKDPSEGTHVFTRDYSDHLNARADYLNQYVVKD